MAFYLSQAGGGGVEVNGIARFNKSPNTSQFTDSSGNEWLRAGVLKYSNLGSYPDATTIEGPETSVLTGQYTFSYTSSFTDSINTSAVFVRNDGYRAYFFTYYGQFVQINFTSPFDADGASYSLGSQLERKPGNWGLFDPGGRHFVYNDGSTMYRQTNNSAWSTSGWGASNSIALGDYANCADMSDDGTKFIYATGPVFKIRTLGSAWTPSTLGPAPAGSNLQTFDKDLYDSGVTGFDYLKINSSGTVIYARNGGSLYKFALREAFNIETIYYTGTKYIFPASTSYFGMSKDFNGGWISALPTSPSYTYILKSYRNDKAIGTYYAESNNDFVRIK